MHNRLYAITLKEQHEQDKKEAEIESERNRMTLEFSNQTSQCSNTVFLSTLTSKLGTHYFEIKLSYEEDDDFCSLLEIAAHTPMKWSSRKLLPVWMKYIYISPIKINEANQYLKDWVGNPENLELLRTLHFQSRIDDKKK